jgi:hypothetical protein
VRRGINFAQALLCLHPEEILVILGKAWRRSKNIFSEIMRQMLIAYKADQKKTEDAAPLFRVYFSGYSIFSFSSLI